MSSGNPPAWTSWASFRPLLRGIGQRVLLVGPILLIVLVASGLLGEYFGVPELFWNQSWPKQALAGFSVALLFAEICLISFLLDAPKPWLQNLPQEAPTGWRRALALVPYGIARVLVPDPPGDPEPDDVRQWRQLRWYLSVSWLPLLVVLLVLVVLDPQQRWGFLPGLAAALVVAAAFVWLFQRWDSARAQLRLRQVMAKLPRPRVMVILLIAVLTLLLGTAWLLPGLRTLVVLLVSLWAGFTSFYAGEVRYGEVPAEHRWVHGLAAASFAMFFLVYQVLFLVCWAAPQFSAWLVPPAVALCVLLAQMVAGHGFLKFHFGGLYTVFAFLILAMAVGFAGFTGYRHQLRELDYDSSNLADLEAADFQMELSDSADAQQLQHLQDSYNRFFTRYENQTRQFGAEPALTRQSKFASVGDVQAEQQKLRDAMLALEQKRLDNWKAKLGGKPKMALVSVTGGANRSAVWTAYTLAQLERELAAAGVTFPQHVRVITGASGGMVGASYFAATLPGPQGHGFADAAAAKAFVRKIGQDALTPVSQRLLFFDLPGAFLPGGSPYDRGLALEQAWDGYLDGALEKSFEQLAAGEAECWRPSLVLSPMIVEDGRRLLISNLYLRPLVETTGRYLSTDPSGASGGMTTATADGSPGVKRPKGGFQKDPRYSLTALEFFQLFPDRWSRFKLATAVRLNASFPYVSPVAALPTNPPRHAVDAGYYDNYGVNLAAWWIYHNAKWIQDNTSGVVVIQIRDAVSERQRLTPMTSSIPPKVWDLQQGLQGITGPAMGASQGLQAIMSFRNDEQLQTLSEMFNEAGKVVPFFATVVFEFPGEVAMSWYLSDQEIERAMTGFESGTANDRALRALRTWFKQ
jgi:hypothetical protein